MPHYVMLMRYRSHGVRAVRANPAVLLAANEALEHAEAKILHSFHLLGEWDQCAIVEAPDNFKAYRASIAHEISATADIDILPAIDLALFQRLISQDARIAGPHPWQIRLWARLARRAMRHYAFTRWVRRYCRPLTITGREKLAAVRGRPCIVIGNHSSHMDHFVLFHALPEWIRWNIYIRRGRRPLVPEGTPRDHPAALVPVPRERLLPDPPRRRLEGARLPQMAARTGLQRHDLPRGHPRPRQGPLPVPPRRVHPGARA